MDKEFYLDTSKTFRKSIVLFKIKGCVHYPIMYLKKPKYITEKEFNEIFERMQIRIKNEN
jgi:hypothetical protein